MVNADAEKETNRTSIFLAHRADDGREHYLADHLNGTAKLAAKFASSFSAGEMGRRAGVLHDIGKYQQVFQERIRGKNVQCDHSSVGAWFSSKENDPITSLCVAGHHTGLPDFGTDASTEAMPTLKGRIKKVARNKQINIAGYLDEISVPAMEIPEWLPMRNGPNTNFSQAFFTRMLFSCLVDADYLDTEAFMFPDKERFKNHATMGELFEQFKHYVARWDKPTGELNCIRSNILRRCLEQGANQRGCYSLTVPTGGGKTTASLGFALRHAVAHSLERIIYVIPYTSIIEQCSNVFRDILGADHVLEHHSNYSFDPTESENPSENARKLRLASENWDIPIIVTTTVQFFESLFSSKSSRCRKLHNMARSVIIFDEAQLIPLEHLYPCVAGVAELVRHYGSTAIFCTATQPFLDRIVQFFAPETPIREIIEDPVELYEKLRRVTYKHVGSLTDEELASQLNQRDRVLCVVNTRKQAQTLFDLLEGEGRFHLSTYMTPNHRRRVLKNIRERLLIDGLPCRVVSTSLIEAGVDIDFPCVFRQETGLDSILQTGGRCNREGNNDRNESVVHVFSSSDHSVPQYVKRRHSAMEHAVRKYGSYDDFETIKTYFEQLRYYVDEVGFRENLAYTREHSFDMSGVLMNHVNFDFRKCCESFRMIDEETITVYIPSDDNKELLERLRRKEVNREDLRKLGMDSVAVYKNHYQLLQHCVEEIREGSDIVAAILWDTSQYTEEKGLRVEPIGGAGFIV